MWELSQLRSRKHAFLILSALVFPSAMASAGERAVPSGKGMTSKLGLLYLDGGRSSEHLPRLIDCGKVPITRYRYRGTKIPTPWAQTSIAH